MFQSTLSQPVGHGTTLVMLNCEHAYYWNIVLVFHACNLILPCLLMAFIWIFQSVLLSPTGSHREWLSQVFQNLYKSWDDSKGVSFSLLGRNSENQGLYDIMKISDACS